MAITDIGIFRTPARPVEITFAAALGLPNPNQTIAMIGHIAASGNALAPYQVYVVSNVADPVAASGEMTTQFGLNSELGLMVIAAINANALGNSFPNIVCVGLSPSDTDWGGGASQFSLNALNKTECEFIVSPYDGNNTALTLQLSAQAALFSGPFRVANSQYGSFGVTFNRSVVNPSALFAYDTQYVINNWLRDTSTGPQSATGGFGPSAFAAPTYSIAQCAAACAGVIAAGQIPFNPLDNELINDLNPPSNSQDWISVGAGLESEIALNQGWTPLKVLPNLTVAFVRTVTARITVGGLGVTQVTAYYDVQDFQVLYYFRKTIVARFTQPDFTQRKASTQTGQQILSEVIRLATLFQTQGMFQAVANLAPQFIVQANASDRSRFDVFVPVNVVPGLHVIATNVQAGTQFDVTTIVAT